MASALSAIARYRSFLQRILPGYEVFGGYTMLFPGKLRYNKKDFIVQKGEKGDLLFSVKTHESLVRECVDMY